MTLSSVIILFLFSLAAAKFLCASAADGQTSSAALQTKEFKKQKEGKEIPLHRFLFEKGKKLGKGAYGKVKAAAGIEPKLVIKKVESNDYAILDAMKKEIATLKELCGKDPKKTYKDLFECESTAIAGFKKKEKKRDEIYIFQEALYMDLKSSDAKSKYRALSGGKKAQVMVDLIRKFQKIHDKNIVHNDIKPANIMMKNNDFSDLRVVDFGVSDRNGTLSLAGTELYFPPERHNDYLLTYKGDIYALALTFVMMEKSARKIILGMNGYCFSGNPDNQCRERFDEALQKAFRPKKKTEFLFRAFQIATAYKPEDRYESMGLFADAIADAAKFAPGFGNNPEEPQISPWSKLLNYVGVGGGIANKILSAETSNIERNLLII